jgi:F-type H+-transporting ATPase subunit b
MVRILSLLTLLLALTVAPAVLAGPSGADSHAADGHGADSHDEGGHDDHGGSHGPPLLAKVVNSLIFFGLLGWFAGPWIAAYFRKRKAQIATDLGAAQAAREEAEAKLAEMEARLAEVDGEVDAILEKASAQAEAEKERILAAAKAEAGRILEQAETQVGELESQAGHRLRGQAADLAVELARGMVTKELADADRAKLFDDYLDGLEKAAG